MGLGLVLQEKFKFYFIMDTFGLLSPQHLEKIQMFTYSLSK